MHISTPTILSQNITLVYQTLELKSIDSAKLKDIFGDPTVIMDTPDMIVALHPPIPLITQIGDRRIRITMQKQASAIGEVPLWDIAHKCNDLLPQAVVVAYGFNYDVRLEVTNGNLQEFLIGQFIHDRNVVESIVKGKLWSFIPRLKFSRESALYDLILEPLSEYQMKAHLNMHFDRNTLPPHKQLEIDFYEGYTYLNEILPGLLDGGE